ncbi:MAG: D-alanine--D-alanine ligase [Bacteroidetes bacterium]|nr:D-alanine--D-alanine ligase [Bacteroidota bacterium]
MKKNLALVTGGFSGEAVIAYKTALTIETHLDKELFTAYKIDINLNGWFYELSDGRKIEVDKNDFSLQVDNQKIKFDAVFISIHGTPGEDGKLQGYFDMLGIPYMGCNAAVSALTFNKRNTVAAAAFAGIDVSKSVLFYKLDGQNFKEATKNLRYPLFVKANNGGSSIGMSKIDKPESLDAAMVKAFNEDDEVLVEEFIEGREFTIGIFQSNGEIIVLPITEVKANADMPFFDFEAKYQGKSTEITPAVINEEMASKLRSAAIRIYQVFNCKGVVRIDFIYNEETGKPFMLEINTIPGQSEASIVPQQVKVMGWSLKEFYTNLLREIL